MRIITTVGVSLLENNEKQFIRYHSELMDHNAFDLNEQLKYQDIKEKAQKIKEASFYNFDGCAEISSLRRIIKELPAKHEKIAVYLLASDTILSAGVAVFIKSWFGLQRVKEGFASRNIEVHFPDIDQKGFEDPHGQIVKNLRIDDRATYNQGFDNLIETIGKILPELKSHGHVDNCIFNITSGYKAIVPIMSTLGHLAGIPLQYLFDERKTSYQQEVIEMAPLPIVGINWILIDACKPFLNQHPIWKSTEGHVSTISDHPNAKAVVKKLAALGLLRQLAGNQYCLSVLGLILSKFRNLGGERGDQMEYIFFHYFSQGEKADEPANPVNRYQAIGGLSHNVYFKESDFSFSFLDIQQVNTIELGDIDLYLRSIDDKELFLCEVKSRTFFRKEAKDIKYYKQLLARKRYYQQKLDDPAFKFERVQVALLVYEFQFEGFEQSILEDQDLNETLLNYKDYEEQLLVPNDQQLDIRVFTAQCPIGLKKKLHLSANYTNFFKTPTFNWEEKTK